MLVKKIECENFLGEKYTETAYFHMTKAELAELEIGTPGGLEKKLENIVKENDNKAMFEFIKTFIGKAYGQVSEDGRRMIKSAEISEEFFQTNAYDVLFSEIASDETAATNFFKQIFPADLAKQMEGSAIPPLKQKVRCVKNAITFKSNWSESFQ